MDDIKKAEEDTLIERYFVQDFEKNNFLDLRKPLLKQIYFGKFTKKKYLDQIHKPRHYGNKSAPLFGNFLEPLSLTAWWLVPLIWIPPNMIMFFLGLFNQKKLDALIYWTFGLTIWSLIEYCMHRFLFHIEYFLPDNSTSITLHFILHGIHHYLPMDTNRLVLPPVLFILLAYPFFKLAFNIFSFYIACSIFSGGMLGYILYDVTHYFLHHKQLPKFAQKIKSHHLMHHYKNHNMKFGVTNKFWDFVFNTL